MALKRKYRLTARIKKTFSRSFHSPLFTLRIGENGLLYNRYGVVVSKKIDKRAVVRNSIKRRAHSCMQEIDNNLKKGYDMLFILKKNQLHKSTNLCTEIQEVCQREKLLL